MEINKVIYGGNTLVDLTSDTVTPSDLVTGVTAHAANGEVITGTMDTYTKTEIDDLLDAKQDVGNYIENGTTDAVSLGGNVAVGSGKLLKVVNVALASSKSISGGAVGEYNAAVNPGTGWTPICTTGTRCNNGRIVMRRVYVSGRNAYVEAFNTGTSSATVNISADVLCIRTSL